MSTDAKLITNIKHEEPICQGDIFRDVRYNFIEEESASTVNIKEYVFPFAVVVSQACDVIEASILMESTENNTNKDQKRKLSKFMPSVLLCPLYNVEELNDGSYLNNVRDNLIQQYGLQVNQAGNFDKRDKEFAQRDYHYKYHIIHSATWDKNCSLVADLKHYFTVSVEYLNKNRKNRIARLEDVFAKQMTQKFCVFLSRVAIP